jgi:cytochrome c5
MRFPHAGLPVALTLMLLSLAAPAGAADDARVAALFAANCAQCHLRPGVGAPMAGAAEEWAPRRENGEDAMLKNVVEGIRGMPPLGYCGACTEDELRALTRMMAGITQ